MDAGYKIPAIAKELIDKGIMPVLPYTKPKGRRNDKESFYPKQYKYDETNDCYICPENKILLYSTTNREGYRIYQSKKSLCENCPSLSKCTRSKSKVKVITRDRKSTRLNSSHVSISYAVFCLKKKNKKLESAKQ